MTKYNKIVISTHLTQVLSFVSLLSLLLLLFECNFFTAFIWNIKFRYRTGKNTSKNKENNFKRPGGRHQKWQNYRKKPQSTMYTMMPSFAYLIQIKNEKSTPKVLDVDRSITPHTRHSWICPLHMHIER